MKKKKKNHICKNLICIYIINNFIGREWLKINKKIFIKVECYLYSALTSLKPGNNIVREESDGRSIKRRTVPGERREKREERGEREERREK